MSGKRISTGDVARALGNIIPGVTTDTVRRWCISKGLGHYRIMTTGKYWYWIDSEDLPRFMEEVLLLSEVCIKRVLVALRLSPRVEESKSQVN